MIRNLPGLYDSKPNDPAPGASVPI
ncbi:hypothetical protein QNM99_21085 [Pseudomonas sp. PCH446]